MVLRTLVRKRGREKANTVAASVDAVLQSIFVPQSPSGGQLKILNRFSEADLRQCACAFWFEKTVAYAAGRQSGSRRAISVTSCRASWCLLARGNSVVPWASSRSRALSSWPKVWLADVAHEQRHVFAQALGLRVGEQVVAFGGKAHAIQCAPGGLRRLRHGGENVGVFDKGERVGRPLASFLIFCSMHWRCASRPPPQWR